MNPRLQLHALNISGPNVSDGALAFDERLTIVAGFSNTGKSYIFQCLKYLLGSSSLPKNIKESAHYHSARLGISTREGDFVLERTLRKASDFKLYALPIHQLTPGSEYELLSQKHSKDDQANISAFLLRQSRFAPNVRLLEGKTDRTTRSLRFHDLRPFFLIDETRIISEQTPVRPSGQFTNRTVETSVFDCLISGEDWRDVIKKPPILKIRTATWDAKESTLGDLIRPLEIQLADVPPPETLAFEKAAAESRIADATRLLRDVGDEMRELNAKRKALSEDNWPREARLRTIEQLLRQFGLLKQSYLSDLERLDFIEEGAALTQQLGTQNCHTCGQPLPDSDERKIHFSPTQQIEAARAEKEKLAAHLVDLGATVKALETEASEVVRQVRRTDAAIQELDEHKRNLWRERAEPIEVRLKEDNQTLTRYIQLLEQHEQLRGLRERRSSLGERPKRQRVEEEPHEQSNHTPTAARRAFCDALEATLRSWRVPEVGTVEFDAEMNIIVSGSPASSNGKGVRAIITSAFAVTLMRFCLKRSLPHPGLVVLDSPLTNYKEQDREEIGEEVQRAFYEDLAKTDCGQLVILENKEPPPDIQKLGRYHFFSRETGQRYGFFPFSG